MQSFKSYIVPHLRMITMQMGVYTPNTPPVYGVYGVWVYPVYVIELLKFISKYCKEALWHIRNF